MTSKTNISFIQPDFLQSKLMCILINQGVVWDLLRSLATSNLCLFLGVLFVIFIFPDGTLMTVL